MAQVHVSQSMVIPVPADTIYAVIADYRVGHPAILPKPYFKELIVEQGGFGEGTIIRFEMEVFGAKQSYHQIVSEPQPGRVLVEKNLDGQLTTTFTLTPTDGGRQTRVTINTEFTPSKGFKGLMERLMNPPVMRYLFKKELQNIAAYVTQPRVAHS